MCLMYTVLIALKPHIDTLCFIWFSQKWKKNLWLLCQKPIRNFLLEKHWWCITGFYGSLQSHSHFNSSQLPPTHRIYTMIAVKHKSHIVALVYIIIAVCLCFLSTCSDNLKPPNIMQKWFTIDPSSIDQRKVRPWSFLRDLVMTWSLQHNFQKTRQVAVKETFITFYLLYIYHRWYITTTNSLIKHWWNT